MQPTVLLVDDSESVLAFERAALGAHYECITAVNGLQAIEFARTRHPEAILLDLSMPVMGGDEALRRMKADAALAQIPVIIVSSEKHREDWCLQQGASAFLGKPVQAKQLLVTLERVLEETRRKRQGMTILPVRAADVRLALPLDSVVTVLPQLETSPIPLGPSYLRESIIFDGRPVFVLDLPNRLGLKHDQALEDRKLVIVRHEQLLLAVSVDDVSDPEELGATDLQPAHTLGGAQLGLLAQALVGVATSADGRLPVLAVHALLSRRLQQSVAALRESTSLAKAVP